MPRTNKTSKRNNNYNPKNNHFSKSKFCTIKNNPYLCIANSTLGQSALWVGLADILFIGVYRRFVLMFSKLRNFQKTISDLATLDVLRVYYINTFLRSAYSVLPFWV